jgi:hypothetical protein
LKLLRADDGMPDLLNFAGSQRNCYGRKCTNCCIT